MMTSLGSQSFKMADKGKGSVQAGGFWSSSTPSYSPQTQTLLKQMMQESKLNNFQQRQLTEKMKTGGTLPLQCSPTTSAKPRQPVQMLPPSKIVNPRTYSGGIRLKEDIEATGAYERPDYKPLPKHMRTDKDKRNLEDMMTYGRVLPEPSLENALKKKAQRKKKNNVPKDRFQELEEEIADRRKFLEEMESLGQGDKLRSRIEAEISQKIREMEIIDKKRSAELERLIEEDRKKRQEQETNIDIDTT